MNYVPYRPQYAQLTGCALAALLLERIRHYAAIKGGQPFFKFNGPCDHPAYKTGDSWQEELIFSRYAFEGARRKIATRIRHQDLKQYQRTHDEHGELLPVGQIVVYWRDADRKLWYWLNADLLALHLPNAAIQKPEKPANAGSPHPTDAGSPHPSNGDNQQFLTTGNTPGNTNNVDGVVDQTDDPGDQFEPKEPPESEKLARSYGIDTKLVPVDWDCVSVELVEANIAYADSQRNLHNRPGFVAKQIRRGEMPARRQSRTFAYSGLTEEIDRAAFNEFVDEDTPPANPQAEYWQQVPGIIGLRDDWAKTMDMLKLYGLDRSVIGLQADVDSLAGTLTLYPANESQRSTILSRGERLKNFIGRLYENASGNRYTVHVASPQAAS